MKKILIVSLLLLSVYGCGKKEEVKNPVEENNNTKIESKASINDLEIELINEKVENGTSEYTFEITNKASETKKINSIQVIAKDSEGNQIITLLGVVEGEIAAGEKTSITCSYGGELENIKTFTYEVID